MDSGAAFGHRRFTFRLEKPNHAVLLRKVEGLSRPTRDFSRPTHDFGHSIRDFSRSTRDLSHSTRDLSHSDRDLSHSTRDFSRSTRDFSRSDRDLSHSTRDFSHSTRDLSHSDRDFSRSDRDFNRSDREFGHSDRDFVCSDRGFIRAGLASLVDGLKSLVAIGFGIGTRRHEMDLTQLVFGPFVIVNAAGAPFLLGAESWSADRLDQAAIRLEGAYVFALLKLIIANDAGPTFKHLRKKRVTVARIDNSRDRTARAATHRGNRVMTGEIYAFFPKLLANAGAIHARQAMTAEIQWRGLAGVDVR